MFRLFVPLLLATAACAGDIVVEPGRLTEALAEARRAPKPVRLVFADGLHPLTEVVRLGPQDAQTTWTGKNAVLTGGRALTGWQPAGEGLWKAALPDKAWVFEQLWVNGRRATRARSPNRGFFHLTEAVAPGVFQGLDTNLNFHTFSIAKEPFETLKALRESERADVLLTVTHAWAVGQCRIEALNEEALAVRIKGRARYPFVEFEPDQRFWLENYRAALDAPGEWFLDKAKAEVLYRPRPGEDLTKAEVIAPVADQFLVIEGAKDLRFEGLHFRHSDDRYPAEGLHDGQAATSVGAAIEIRDSRGIHFDNCEIAHTGRHALWFKNGCADSSVKHCHLHDFGGGGVYVGETTRPEDARVNRHIVIDDCILQHGGRRHPSACGVVFTHTRHCAVVHCDIGDFYYSGVSAGWNWGYGDTASRETRVENNHIHHLGWAYLSDMGGFYGLGTSPGTIVRGNHVHHIASHRYGGWGLYNDEGSADVTMENNLVHDTSNAGFHQHYGYFNTVRNNIFAFGREAQIQASRNEPRLRFRYLNNLVVWDAPAPLLDGGEWNWQFFDRPERGDPKDSLVFRNNLYWRTDGRTPDTLTKTHFTWEQWRKMGRDTGSRFADQRFEDLAKRDFRLKPDSPALKLGFQPWDLTLAGVRKADAAWVKLAAQGHDYPTWATDAQPWPAPRYQVDQNFERVAPGQLGIRSASYEKEGKGESIGVTDKTGSPFDGGSKRSLQVQDAPGLRRSYEPVLHLHPRWQAGTFRVRFDLMAEPGADGFFEIRDGAGGEFAAGPYLRWQKGVLVANNSASRKLAELPPGEWLRVEITATTGAGSYDVTVTRADGTRSEFQDLPCKPSWARAGYVLFSALGTTQTAFYLDNLQLDPVAP